MRHPFLTFWVLLMGYLLLQQTGDLVSGWLAVPYAGTAAGNLLACGSLLLCCGRFSKAVGLGRPHGTAGFLPLFLLSTVNLWGGIGLRFRGTELICYTVTAAGAAFLEEVLFRGVLFQAMKKKGPAAALLGSSLVFGLMHLVNLFAGVPASSVLMQAACAVCGGILYGAVFFRCGSLWPCIAAHGLMNLLWVFSPGDMKPGLWAVQGLLTAACGGAVFAAEKKSGSM